MKFNYLDIFDRIPYQEFGLRESSGRSGQYADKISLGTVLNSLNYFREQLGDYGTMWFKP